MTGLYHVNMATRAQPAKREPSAETPDVRQRILDTASTLFYERGVRAVGVDLVVDESGVAKTSLYRHFRTKDDLIVAFLEREDVEFWGQWDAVAARHADDPAGEIEAHMRWIGKRLARANYRGCPQINVAAEFAEVDHPAREVSKRHMQALRARLAVLARQLGAARPHDLAAQLGLLINGAFVSASMLAPDEATRVLLASARALLEAAASPPAR
jgi:AcrR family transcriptional regulator